MIINKYFNYGFSILESIVSLAFIASVGIALFGLINSSLFTLNKLQDKQEYNDAIHNTMAFMEVINPMLLPEGIETIGIYKIKWKSDLLIESKDNIDPFYRGRGLYVVAMYKVNIEVSFNDKTTNFFLKKIGYKKVRNFEL